MKNLIYHYLPLLLIIPISITYSQTNLKTWTETAVQDFSDNQLTDLIITNNSDGEVQLPHPLVKTVNDYNDNSIHRFIAKDSVDNFVKTWITAGNVFVKKYSADGSGITNTIQVNEINGSVDDFGSRVAMLKDGIYIVIWKNNSYAWYGQIFKNDSIKSGINFRINEINNEHSAVAIADNKDHTFLLFYTQKITEKYKLHIQKRDISGDKIGESKFLNPEFITKLEISPSAVEDEDGFWVAWDGANGDTSWDLDLYLRRFNYDGSPDGSAIIVNDDLEKMQGGADLCIDNKSNLLIAWLDERDAIEPITSGQLNVYGQIFDSLGIRIGNNIKLNSIGDRKENREVDVEFLNNEFEVSWLYWDEPNRRYLTYINKWKLEPKLSGEMISSVFDASPSGSLLKKIFWDRTTYSGTYLKFQIRTGKTLGGLNNSNWYGPLSVSDFYINNIGENINSIHNENRYIQYKAIFTSNDGNTSILKSINIQFSPFDTIPPLPPMGLTATPSHASIILQWQPNNNLDLFGYKLYRGIQSGVYNNNWEVFILKGTLTYKDTSVEVNKKYFYVLTAVDSSHNDSDYSEEVSGIAFGINIYVSSSGNSNGDGSINNPFKTVQQGIDAAVSGDTVRVSEGNYYEPINMKYGVSIIGVNPELCKINTTVTASDNCVIKGFTFTKSLTCSYASPVITENVFIGTSQTFMPSISISNFSSPTITKNFITECGVGIALDYKCNPIIKNNIIKANEIGLRINWENNPTVINNTIITGNLDALQLSSFYDTVKIENNIVVRGLSIGFSPVVKINYNDIWCLPHEHGPLPETNIFLDPQFVNMDLNDYHLLSTSPCINAGNPDPVYNDIDGTRNDMGAYGGPDPIQSNLSLQLSKSISISNLSGYPGDTVSVFVSLDNTSALAKADFIIDVDNSILNYVNAKLTNATHNFEMQSQIISGGEVKFSLSSATGAQADLKEILEVKYLVNENSLTGDASPITLKGVILFDVNLREIYIRSSTNGAFIVSNIYYSENYLYVDSKSSNSGDGSRENPFNTIMKAVNIASAGDTIFVYGGNYYESVFMKEGITLVGGGASVTYIIVASDSTALIFNNINNAEISGFTIKADENHYSHIPLLICESSSPIIKKNKFEASEFNEIGIDFNNNSNVEFENNYVLNGYINVRASNPTLENNVIEGGPTGAISCYDGAAPLISKNILGGKFASSAILINNSNAIVKNNLIYCSEVSIGVFFWGANNSGIYNNIIKDKGATGVGMIVFNSSNNKIVNNSIITRGKGIEENNSLSTILNNIVINNNNFGLQLSSTSYYDYNDVWNNFVNYNGIDPGIHDISYDPLFVDTAKGDYRLSLNSSCINAGNPSPEYNDLDGSRNDIGAYGGPFTDSSWIYTNGSSLAIDSITAMSVDTIQIMVTGENLKGIAEVNMTLSFDPMLLNIIAASSGSITKSFSLEKTNLGPGSINLSLRSNKGITEENGELIQLQLVINSNRSLNTFLHFDSVAVRDETTCLGNIINVKDGQIKITTDLDNDYSIVPKKYSLYQNYPNPFNPATTIMYELPKESEVKLVIYNILGEKVVELVNTFQKSGRYEVEWNAINYASGVYFYKLTAKDFIQTKKMILAK